MLNNRKFDKLLNWLLISLCVMSLYIIGAAIYLAFYIESCK